MMSRCFSHSNYLIAVLGLILVVHSLRSEAQDAPAPSRMVEGRAVDVLDPSTGVESVFVTLRSEDSASAVKPLKTLTDSTGQYSFDGVSDGKYILEFEGLTGNFRFHETPQHIEMTPSGPKRKPSIVSVYRWDGDDAKSLGEFGAKLAKSAQARPSTNPELAWQLAREAGVPATAMTAMVKEFSDQDVDLAFVEDSDIYLSTTPEQVADVQDQILAKVRRGLTPAPESFGTYEGIARLLLKDYKLDHWSPTSIELFVYNDRTSDRTREIEGVESRFAPVPAEQSPG